MEEHETRFGVLMTNEMSNQGREYIVFHEDTVGTVLCDVEKAKEAECFEYMSTYWDVVLVFRADSYEKARDRFQTVKSFIDSQESNG